MKRNHSLLVLLAAFAIAPSIEAQAVRSASQGFHVGFALNGSSIQMNDADYGDSTWDNGGGVNLNVGYNFTPNLGINLTVAGASITSYGDSYGLGQADLAGRYSFSQATRALVPYVEAGFTGVSMSTNFDGYTMELQGAGLTGAVGLNYFFTPRVALDTNFRYTKGEFNTVKVGSQSVSDDDGVGINTGRFNVGVAYFFSGGR